VLKTKYIVDILKLSLGSYVHTVKALASLAVTGKVWRLVGHYKESI